MDKARALPLRVDGAEPSFWEPLWQLHVALSPLERALLGSSSLRRLHFIAHNGSSALLTGLTYSRLQHTLGVFALVAHFRPHDERLRAAALLHDIGHFPFSHTLEALPGIDHHASTRRRLDGPELTGIFRTHGLELTDVAPLLGGHPASLLRNDQGVLHLDHLDSWVRGAQARGQLKTLPADILKRAHEVDGYLELDAATAEEVVELIVAEARFHVSAANLGSSAVLQKLVATLLDAGDLTVPELSEMTDAELTARLFASPRTASEARTLWFGPARLQTTRRTVRSAALVVRQDKLYLSLPRVQGGAIDSPKVRTLIAEARSLLGDYGVFWQA